MAAGSGGRLEQPAVFFFLGLWAGIILPALARMVSTVCGGG